MKDISNKYLQLEKGQVFRNYGELCHFLEEKKLTSDSKNAQLERWGLYFKWQREGHKFIIEKVLLEPMMRKPAERTNAQLAYVVLYDLITANTGDRRSLNLELDELEVQTLYRTDKDLQLLTGMVNSEFFRCKQYLHKTSKKEIQKEFYEVFGGINYLVAEEFYKDVSLAVHQNVRRLVEYMNKTYAVVAGKTYLIEFQDGEQAYAGEDLKVLITRAIRETLLKDKWIPKQNDAKYSYEEYEIILQKRQAEFYKEVLTHKELIDLGIKSFYKVHEFKMTLKDIKNVKRFGEVLNVSETYKKAINEKIQELINNQSKRRKEEQKKVEEENEFDSNLSIVERAALLDKKKYLLATSGTYEIERKAMNWKFVDLSGEEEDRKINSYLEQHVPSLLSEFAL